MAHWLRIVALGLGLGWAVTILIAFTMTGGLPVDAWCYYRVRPADPYDPDHCFLYSPPVAQAMLGDPARSCRSRRSSSSSASSR